MKIIKTALLTSALAATIAGPAFAGDAPAQQSNQLTSARLDKLNNNTPPIIQTLSPKMARKMLATAENKANLTEAVVELGVPGETLHPNPVHLSPAVMKKLNNSATPSIQALPPKKARKMLINAKYKVRGNSLDVETIDNTVDVNGGAPNHSTTP